MEDDKMSYELLELVQAACIRALGYSEMGEQYAQNVVQDCEFALRVRSEANIKSFPPRVREKLKECKATSIGLLQLISERIEEREQEASICDASQENLPMSSEGHVVISEEVRIKGHLSRSLFPDSLSAALSIVDPPRKKGDPRPPPGVNVLVLLPGVGDSAAPYAKLAHRLGLPDTTCLVLPGPLIIPETDGGRAWFQIFDQEWNLIKPVPGETRRLDSLTRATQLLRTAVDRIHSHGWPYSHIHILGFSNGGTVALEAAKLYSGPKQLGGVIAVSASMLPESLERCDRTFGGPSSVGCPTRVLITHGTQDQVVSRKHVDQTIQHLKSLHPSANVQHHYCNKGHEMPRSQGEMRKLIVFWSETLKASSPFDS